MVSTLHSTQHAIFLSIAHKHPFEQLEPITVATIEYIYPKIVNVKASKGISESFNY